MRILGIDPAIRRVGVVMWQPDPPKISHTIYDPVSALEYFREISNCGATIPDRIGIEMIGHYGKGMPAGKDVFDTCIFIGRTIEILRLFSPVLIMRQDIKLHFCNSVRAKDSNIRQSLIDRFGNPGVKASPGLLYGVKGDEWSALAVAVYIWDKVK